MIKPGDLVKVHKWVETKIQGKKTIIKSYEYTGVFIEFGIEFEELTNGVGQFSTAIVQKSDGFLESVPVELIKCVNDI